jgi:hypothetical protein
LGIDILDLVFRLERRFGTKISRSDLDELIGANDPPDILVGALFDFVRKRANPSGVFDEEMDAESLWPIFRREVSDSLGVEEDEVTKDKWLIRELGMG